MKSRLLFLIVSCFSLTLFGQTPELVADFNPGPDDGLNCFNFKSIEIGSRLIFPVVNSDVGEELGVLEDGTLTLLKDINEGPESSRPGNFIYFNDKVYFSAVDETNGAGIWSTDGTAENTQIEFSYAGDVNTAPRGMIVSESGWLYYTVNTELYRTDGEVSENIFSGVRFFTESQQQSNNYATYQEEIAFLVEKNNYFIQLYAVQGDSVVLLGSSDETSGFADVFGLSEVSGGLIFGLEDSFEPEITGTYYYDEQAGSVGKITISGGGARRLHDFTDEASLAWVGGQGYFMTNGQQGEEQLLFSSENQASVQGEPIPNGVVNGKMVFVGEEAGFFGDKFVFYTDGTTEGTTQLFEVNTYLSNVLVYGNFAFIASGVSNLFDPELYYINMTDGSFSNFYNFNQSSTNPKSVLPLGVQDNKLYYLSNLDNTIGRELYSISLDIDTDVEQLDKTNFSIRYTPTTYTIETDELIELVVDLHTTDGRLIRSERVTTNQPYRLPDYRGIGVLSFILNGERRVDKFFRGE